MNKITSLYLDFLRVIAAFGVLMVHSSLYQFSNNMFLHQEMGHKLVMIFFVLSGFLIAYSVSAKNKNFKTYTIDRLSRLYSVVIPALIFTYLIDGVGSYINPTLYSQEVAPDNQLVRALMNFAFIQQIWGFCSKPSSNGVFWSISYEFWYYFLFGIFSYLAGYKRILLLLVVCFIVGLKILLLLPVWIMGVICFNYSDKIKINKVIAAIIFIASSILIIYLGFFYHSAFLGAGEQEGHGRAPLFFSTFYLFDWFYGGLVAINIFSLNAIKISEISFNKIPSFVIESIRYLSSITFTLYLFHWPLLLFVGAVVPYNKGDYMQLIPLIVLVVICIAGIASFTEKKRGFYKNILEVIFAFVERNLKLHNKTKEA